jgi:surface protein
MLLASCGDSNTPDTTAPVITLSGASTITLFQHDVYSELGASANDDIDGQLEVSITGTVDTSSIGSYSLAYTATDNAGNTSTFQRTVIVQQLPDTTAPVITLSGASTITIFQNETYEELGASATDDIDGELEVIITGTVDVSIGGTYIVIYTATDSAGNISSLERTVTVQRPFITTWQTWGLGKSNDNQITISTVDGQDYNYRVRWGDGSEDENVTGNITHTYAQEGTYTVMINGDFPQLYNAIPIYIDNPITYLSDSEKLRSIEQWGDIKWRSMNHAFAGCWFLEGNATDTPDLSSVKDMSRMFEDTAYFNQDIGNWDVSNVTNMSGMFYFAFSFNQDISNWNVSNVTDMSEMILGAREFNQDISNWDVSKVTDMSGMFKYAESFNQDINSWDVSNVTDMSNMFLENAVFNQDISGWDVSRVTDMSGMFEFTGSFNQDINSWNVSNVTDMSGMFYFAFSFNQDISNWDVSNVTDMRAMFEHARAFNQDISNWDVANVTDMRGMFEDARSFNQDISNWDVSNVTDMNRMFRDAISFNQEISNWDVSNMTDMSRMFGGAIAFNQDISNWDVSNVTDMRSMFGGATAFNQDISDWDVSNVTDMGGMFFYATLSTENYDALLTSWSTLSLKGDVYFHAGDSKYSASSQSARDMLINFYGWKITDGGLDD